MRMWNLRGLQQYAKEQPPRQRRTPIRRRNGKAKLNCGTCADTKTLYDGEGYDERGHRRLKPCPYCADT